MNNDKTGKPMSKYEDATSYAKRPQTPRHTARPNPAATGFVDIVSGTEMLTSFWAWDLRAVTKDPKTGQTQLCFRDSMWLPTTAGVADVMAAVSAAMAAYSAIDRKVRAA